MVLPDSQTSSEAFAHGSTGFVCWFFLLTANTAAPIAAASNNSFFIGASSAHLFLAPAALVKALNRLGHKACLVALASIVRGPRWT